MSASPAREPAGGDEDPDQRAPEPSGSPAEYESVPWEPVVTRPDWMTEEEQQALLDAVTDDDAPWWLEEGDHDPGDDPPPEDYDLAEIAAECRQAAEDQARAAANAARLGSAAALGVIGAARRGPGQPGSARRVPGEYPSRAAQFATGMLMDVMPGRPELAVLADEAAGPQDRFDGASDDEVLGVLCAWDRVEAHAAARKHAAVAELIRRRPAPGHAPEGPARMPPVWEEFTASELGAVLGQSRWDADHLLGLAHDLEVKLPGTKAAFLDGIVNAEKAEIIARATAVLDPAGARAAEARVLGRAGRLTPAGLRSAIARAVIEVAPEKAKERRKKAEAEARVERWAEVSGNGGLAGRELPPAAVMAADQKISYWARQLKKAGLGGSMDELRARAYIDLLLGTDSRPGQDTAGGQDTMGGGESRPPDPSGPGTGALPAGFAGRVNLTIPLATLLGLAERPGEIPGLGPIDPDLARDLANAAARNPATTWCVTVTDQDGHAIGHGCARPQPKGHIRHREKRGPPGPRDGPGFAFTASGQQGPPGGYGSWRLSTRTGGQRDLLVTLDPIPIDECDHRFQAKGHDPGVKLRHLSQIRHATCTGPGCRRPSTQADFEHNIPYEAGGRSCLCNGGPKCRYDHRLKQHPRWKVEQLPGGVFRWTTPSGRQCTTEATRYPV